MVLTAAVSFLRAVPAGAAGHRKHLARAHPLLSLALSAVAIIAICFAADDALGVGSVRACCDARAAECARLSLLARGFGAYAAVLAALKVASVGVGLACYEYLWACNIGVALAAAAAAAKRPTAVAAAALSVAIDQLLWYVDLPAFAISGRWPIGVAKYLTWPETSWARVVMSTHHFWFIPACVAVVAPWPTASGGSRDTCELIGGGIGARAYLLSLFVIASEAALCRFLVPFELLPQSRAKRVYMNINLTHEVWRDVPFQFLQVSAPRSCACAPSKRASPRPRPSAGVAATGEPSKWCGPCRAARVHLGLLEPPVRGPCFCSRSPMPRMKKWTYGYSQKKTGGGRLANHLFCGGGACR